MESNSSIAQSHQAMLSSETIVCPLSFNMMRVSYRHCTPLSLSLSRTRKRKKGPRNFSCSPSGLTDTGKTKNGIQGRVHFVSNTALLSKSEREWLGWMCCVLLQPVHSRWRSIEMPATRLERLASPFPFLLLLLLLFGRGEKKNTIRPFIHTLHTYMSVYI